MRHRIRTAAVALPLLCVMLPLWGCAARKHLERGHAAALRGDAVRAEYHFEHALQKRDALAHDAGFREALRQARRDAALRRGDDAAGREQWETAVTLYEASLAQEPGYAPAARGREQAGSRAAAELYATAVQRADYDDLPAARMLLEQALRIQPGYADARAALQSLHPTQGPTDAPPAGSLTLARDQAANALWSQAESAYNRVITTTPTFLPARAELHRLRGDAADGLIDRGRAALEAGDPGPAEAWFRESLRFRPNDPRVRRGLADTDLLRGQRFAAEGRPGAALLATRAALGHIRDDRRALAAIELHTATLRAAFAAPLRLAVEPGTPHADDARAVSDELAMRLIRRYGAALRLADAPDPDGDSAVTLRVVELNLERPAPRQEVRHHGYQVECFVPNPRIEDLRSQLDREHACIEDLQRDESRLCDQLARARSGCDDGLIFHLEFRLKNVRRDLRDACDRRDRLGRDLRHTPATIRTLRAETWPYTAQLHEQHGVLRGLWSFNGRPASPFTATFHEADAFVADANPQVGLPEDPLELTEPERVRRRLIAEAAERIAPQLARAVLEARVVALDSAAEEALESTDAGGALERRVAAAVLAATLDPQAGEARLDGLALPVP